MIQRKFLPLFFFLISVGAFAHHGNSEYDHSQVINIEGVVTKFEWRNPHAYLYLRTVNEQGNARELRIESASPSALFAYGVDRNSFSLGETVTATVSPSRNTPATTAFGYQVRKQDGSVIPLTIRGAAEVKRNNPGAKTLAGIWVPRQEYFYQMIQSRDLWPMTAKARKAWEHYDIKQSPGAQCIPLPPPTLMTFPNITAISLHDDYVTMVMDGQGALANRTIYMDGRQHPAADQRFLHGHSVGQWQGTSLLVDTTNFTPNISGSIVGIPGGIRKKLTESFTLAQDGHRLLYHFKVEDPEFLSEPYEAEFAWDYRPDLKLTDVDCDVEVASRYLKE